VTTLRELAITKRTGNNDKIAHDLNMKISLCAYHHKLVSTSPNFTVLRTFFVSKQDTAECAAKLERESVG